MTPPTGSRRAQDVPKARVDDFQDGLGPFVVAAENTPMPMIFIDAQVERHPVVFVNDSYLSLTGFARADIVGEEIAIVLKQVADPDTRSAIEIALHSGVAGTWETHCLRANGDALLARIFLSPLADNQGKIRQHFLGFVEVSNRVNRFKEQRDDINALFELSPGFVASLEGHEHRFRFANASYKRLVGREDVVGHRVCDILPEIASQGFLALLDQVFETGEPFLGYGVPIDIPAKPASPFDTKYINFVYQPIRGADGAVTGVFVEGYDVTAERLATEQLSLLQGEVAQASRINAMGMMAATLAHELNQPLTAISAYAGACVRLVDPDTPRAEALAEALRAIEEAAQRAGHIIRNVRELTKRGATPKTSFKLKLAMAECVKLVRAGGCDTATIEDRTPEELVVSADRLQIQQVVINLLRNACDATVETGSGHITVDAVSKGAEIEVSVTDTGQGLSSEAVGKIFQLTDSSKEGGTGLGLSISRTMIEAQNGRIWLERSDLSGSQFCFTVPAAGPLAESRHGS